MRHLDVEELKMYPSRGCMEHLSPDPESRGGTPGGDSEVEPGRKVESKETCPGGHLPRQADFQQVSDPQRG